MNKFDRVVSFLIILQTKKVITAATIADRFEVSLRTVYRDINTLKNAGIPIIGDPGIGYSIMDGYRLPPVMFNEAEALSLLAAEKILANSTDEETQKHYAGAMAKIKAVLQSSEKEALDILDDSISISPIKSEEHKPYLTELFKSIANRRLIKISYQKADRTTSERTIEPLGSYHNANKWYLVAYCQLKQDFRTFKMNRIQDLISLDQTFNKRNFSLQQYLEKQAQEKKELEEPQVVEVLFDHAITVHADKRKYYFGLIDETNEDHGVRMKFWTSSLEFMARWIIPFTNQAHVIQPQELKNRIKELSQELYNHYR